MGCKIIGLAIRDTLNGKPELNIGFPYIIMLVTIFFIAIQMNYLNKVLDIFNASIVTPIYYVLFTILVIIASAILFQEWKHMRPEDIVGDLCGFFVVISAVILLNGFKDIDICMSDVRGLMRPKRALIEHEDSRFNNLQQSTLESREYGTTAVRNL